MLAIIRAMRVIAGTEAASAYLREEACFQGLLDETEEERLRHGVASFGLIVGDIGASFGQRFGAGLATLKTRNRAGLLRDLHRSHRKLLYQALNGAVPYEEGLTVLRATLQRYGLDLDRLLQEQEHGTPDQVRLNAALRNKIAAALTRYSPRASAMERFAAQRAIERAFTDYLSEHPVFKGVANPSELFRLWKAADARSRKLKKGRST